MPNLASFKTRHRYQFTWPDEDFDNIGKSPHNDASVNTYININNGLKNEKGSR